MLWYIKLLRISSGLWICRSHSIWWKLDFCQLCNLTAGCNFNNQLLFTVFCSTSVGWIKTNGVIYVPILFCPLTVFPVMEGKLLETNPDLPVNPAILLALHIRHVRRWYERRSGVEKGRRWLRDGNCWNWRCQGSLGHHSHRWQLYVHRQGWRIKPIKEVASSNIASFSQPNL